MNQDCHQSSESILILKLKNDNFKISKFSLAQFSNRFKQNFELFQKDSYDVQSDVSKQSLETFISACNEQVFCISKENVFDLQELCVEFDSPAILSYVLNYYEEYNHTINETIDNLIQLKNKNLDYSLVLQKIAKKMFLDLLEFPKIFQLNPDILKEILFYPERDKTHESKLLNVAKEFKKKGKDNSFILQAISLNNLTIEELKEFINSENFPEQLYSQNVISLIDNNIEKIYELETKLNKKETQHPASQSNFLNINAYNSFTSKLNFLENASQFFQLNPLQSDFGPIESYPFEGTIHKLKQDHPDDFNNYFEIIHPYQDNPKFPVSNIIENSEQFINLSCFLKVPEGREDDNCVIFHFKVKNFSLCAFSIRTNSFGSSIAHPKQFEILGSTDGNSWSSIYKYDDVNLFLYGKKKYQIFKLQERSNFYSYFKYQQYEAHCQYSDSNRIISLSAIEFFGHFQNEIYQ